jgi:cytochrome c-type biogenesis protein CcmH/NrfF
MTFLGNAHSAEPFVMQRKMSHELRCFGCQKFAISDINHAVE